MRSILLAVFLAYSSPALAYLDPGSGSYLVQFIVSGVALVLGTARWWLGFFKRGRGKHDASSTQENTAKRKAG